MEGLRVGVTGARKGAQLCAALQRRGAEVLWGPMLAPDASASDASLLAATDAVLRARPAWVVLSTGVGVRAWLAAADRGGRGKALRSLLGDAAVAARGPKAQAALRGIGVEAVFVSRQETDADVAGWLLPQLGPGQAVAVQVHGTAAVGVHGTAAVGMHGTAAVGVHGTAAVGMHGGDGGADAYRGLAASGARILRVAPYACRLPSDVRPARRLISTAVAGGLDALTATSGPAVANLFLLAHGIGLRDALARALRGPVAAAAVGAVTAAAFEEAGVPVRVMPNRARSADLVHSLERWAANTAPRNGQALRLVPSSRVVQVPDGAAVLGPREFAVLAALVRRPGTVCPPALLAREAWGHGVGDAPAQVKHAIARIRRKLGAAGGMVQTVRGVGYRYWPVTPPPPTAETA